MKNSLYILDTETTGLAANNSIIEISLIRVADGTARTWYLRADEPEENIQPEALKINGSRLEDILCKTAFGKETYKEPSQVIADIENFLAEDDAPVERRILVGQNLTGFDREKMVNLWKKYDQINTYPFNRRIVMDTVQQEMFINHLTGDYFERNNLGSLVERYGVKKLKAHRSLDDCWMTLGVFNAQVERMKKLMKE